MEIHITAIRRLCLSLATTAALVILALPACSTPAAPAALTDDAGASIKIAALPQRIVSLAPSNTEIVYALGLGGKLVGVTEYCNYPPEARKVARVGGFSTVDIEKTVALQPDLILAADIHSKSVTPTLQKIGFNVVTLNPKTLQAVLDDIMLTGRVTGQQGQADALGGDLRRRIDSVQGKTAPVKPTERPRVLVLIWHDPLMAAGSGTLIDDIIATAGGANIAGDLSGHQGINLEAIISRDPQVIIIPASMGTEGSPTWNYVNEEVRFKGISAVRDKRLHRTDGDVIYRYGPRSVDGLEALAGFIHPKLFPPAR
jgi:iron complex transport system substrate-binding protein